MATTLPIGKAMQQYEEGMLKCSEFLSDVLRSKNICPNSLKRERVDRGDGKKVDTVTDGRLRFVVRTQTNDKDGDIIRYEIGEDVWLLPGMPFDYVILYMHFTRDGAPRERIVIFFADRLLAFCEKQKSSIVRELVTPATPAKDRHVVEYIPVSLLSAEAASTIWADVERSDQQSFFRD